MVVVRADNEHAEDFEERYLRRPDGQYTEWSVDYGADGTYDDLEIYAFGDDDLADTREYRFDLQATISDRSTYLNADGLRMQEDFDAFGDGTVDATLIHAYDELDRVVEMVTDLGVDGVPEHTLQIAYLRDTELPTSVELDEWGNGTLDRTETNEYDEADRLTRWLTEYPLVEYVVDTTYAYLDPDEPYDEADREILDRGEVVETSHSAVRHDREGRLLEEVTTYTTYPEVPDYAKVATSTRRLDWTCP
jgi:hypothetical protein